jgi:hypothetical protein
MGSLEITYALNTTKNRSTPPIMFLKTFKQVTNGSLPVFLSLTSNTMIHNNYKKQSTNNQHLGFTTSKQTQ